MFPEAAEARMPLKPESEKENANKETPDNHNVEILNPVPDSRILPPAHLNGSIKLSVSETADQEERSGKVDVGTTVTPEEESPKHSLWKWPSGQGKFTKVNSPFQKPPNGGCKHFSFQMTWILTWPIHLVFLFTIPDCEKPRYKKWFPLTFIMCIIWIGSLSYVVAWMITIIGKLASFLCRTIIH